MMAAALGTAARRLRVASARAGGVGHARALSHVAGRSHAPTQAASISDGGPALSHGGDGRTGPWLRATALVAACLLWVGVGDTLADKARAAYVARAMVARMERGGPPGWEQRYWDGHCDVPPTTSSSQCARAPATTGPRTEAAPQGLVGCPGAVLGGHRAAPRSDVVARVAAAMQGAARRKLYGVVVGPVESGKSVAVRTAIRQRPFPRGVLYVQATDRAGDFVQTLSDVCGLTDNGLLLSATRFSTAGEPDRTWSRLCSALLQAARAYVAQHIHSDRVVLVIDDADRLAEADPDFFGRLLQFAARCDETRVLAVVFVGRTAPLLTAMVLHRSESGAFARSCAVEVPPLTVDEAVALLVAEGTPRAQAEQAVHSITGGLFPLLRTYQRLAADGADADAIQASLVERLEHFVRGPKGLVLSDALAGQLVAAYAGTGPAVPWLDIDSGDRSQADVVSRLVKAGVLSLHPDHTISFAAPFIATYFARSLRQHRRCLDAAAPLAPRATAAAAVAGASSGGPTPAHAAV